MKIRKLLIKSYFDGQYASKKHEIIILTLVSDSGTLSKKFFLDSFGAILASTYFQIETEKILFKTKTKKKCSFCANHVQYALIFS